MKWQRRVINRLISIIVFDLHEICLPWRNGLSVSYFLYDQSIDRSIITPIVIVLSPRNGNNTIHTLIYCDPEKDWHGNIDTAWGPEKELRLLKGR